MSSYNSSSIYHLSSADTAWTNDNYIPMTDAAKRRVDRATAELSGKRCLIENTAESNSVEYVHCLGRETSEAVLDKIEFSWKIQQGTLNVDTRQNVLRLSAKFQEAFNASRWLLLPESSIIDAYYDASRTGPAGDLPDINETAYKYRLIAHPNMWSVPIHRQQNIPPEAPKNQRVPLLPSDFTYYPHPYHDFPILNSHVHPRFAIYNGGAKLDGDLVAWQEQHPSFALDLSKVLSIWKEWTSVTPPKAFYQKKGAKTRDDAVPAPANDKDEPKGADDVAPAPAANDNDGRKDGDNDDVGKPGPSRASPTGFGERKEDGGVETLVALGGSGSRPDKQTLAAGVEPST